MPIPGTPPDVARDMTVADSDDESGFVNQSRRLGGLLVATSATVPSVQANRLAPRVVGRTRRLVLVDGSQGEGVESELARSVVDPMTNDSDREFGGQRSIRS